MVIRCYRLALFGQGASRRVALIFSNRFKFAQILLIVPGPHVEYWAVRFVEMGWGHRPSLPTEAYRQLSSQEPSLMSGSVKEGLFSRPLIIRAPYVFKYLKLPSPSTAHQLRFPKLSQGKVSLISLPFVTLRIGGFDVNRNEKTGQNYPSHTADVGRNQFFFFKYYQENIINQY